MQLAAVETVGDRTVPHAGSAKPPESGGGGAGQSWQLRLSAPEGEARSVKLSPQEEGTLKGTVPEGGSVYLLDLDNEKRVPEGAELDLKAGETRRLKAIVGTKGYAEKASEGIDLTDLHVRAEWVLRTARALHRPCPVLNRSRVGIATPSQFYVHHTWPLISSWEYRRVYGKKSR
ncbi:MAG: hypothetical protein BRD55_04320 [Bacteroidetes bacterium SW_9_63_38]|nr:MAG: hypothetical protein BRD55_04320 [Bacteroidetes bacterium SW_9_63_38]